MSFFIYILIGFLNSKFLLIKRDQRRRDFLNTSRVWTYERIRSSTPVSHFVSPSFNRSFRLYSSILWLFFFHSDIFYWDHLCLCLCKTWDSWTTYTLTIVMRTRLYKVEVRMSYVTWIISPSINLRVLVSHHPVRHQTSNLLSKK